MNNQSFIYLSTIAKESPLSLEEALRLRPELDFSAAIDVGPRTRTLDVSGITRFDEAVLSPPVASLLFVDLNPGLTQHSFFSKLSYSTDSNTGRIGLP